MFFLHIKFPDGGAQRRWSSLSLSLFLEENGLLKSSKKFSWEKYCFSSLLYMWFQLYRYEQSQTISPGIALGAIKPFQSKCYCVSIPYNGVVPVAVFSFSTHIHPYATWTFFPFVFFLNAPKERHFKDWALNSLTFPSASASILFLPHSVPPPSYSSYPPKSLLHCRRHLTSKEQLVVNFYCSRLGTFPSFFQQINRTQDISFNHCN